MRTDPRKACSNEKQLLGWAILHDLVAHPFMVLTGYSALSLRFHDATSRHAWPRAKAASNDSVLVPSDRFGPLRVVQTLAGFFEIAHGRIAHRFVVKATDLNDAVEQAEEWFSSLSEFIPESDAAHAMGKQL